MERSLDTLLSVRAQINKIEAWMTLQERLQEQRAECTIYVDFHSSMLGSIERKEINLYNEGVTKEFVLSAISEKIAIEQVKLEELLNCKP